MALQCTGTLLDYIHQRGLGYSDSIAARKILTAMRRNLNISKTSGVPRIKLRAYFP
jgi:hypothetical protein